MKLNPVVIRRSAQMRFWDKVLIGDGCWEWQGNRQGGGYGSYSVGHTTVIAHRFAYEDRIGPIPEGFTIDHTCHNTDPNCAGGPTCTHRRCVNPGHLEAVTSRVNSLRSPNTSQTINAAKTHCPQGHPYDEANTYYRPGRPIGRACRLCMRSRSHEHWVRKREQRVLVPRVRVRKAHCPRGHPYTEENTYRRPNGNVECRICKQDQQIARQARLKAV